MSALTDQLAEALREFVASDGFRIYTASEWQERMDAAASLLDKYGAAKSAPAALAGGWVLVPREPTPEMLRAGFLSESNGFDIETPADAPGLVYRAMLAAAPPAPAEPAPLRLTCGQIAQLAGFAGEDGEPFEDQSVLVIEHRVDGRSGAGLYAHYEELPEEGAIHLDGKWPERSEPSSPAQVNGQLLLPHPAFVDATRFGDVYSYSADQMHSYARAAIAALQQPKECGCYTETTYANGIDESTVVRCAQHAQQPSAQEADEEVIRRFICALRAADSVVMANGGGTTTRRFVFDALLPAMEEQGVRIASTAAPTLRSITDEDVERACIAYTGSAGKVKEGPTRAAIWMRAALESMFPNGVPVTTNA
ncbi:hypothetical protein [Dokdonella soli]|uniref:Uncharacterized protein n=1 Tax=Dokdonella soli TaxID=529810 RepID=A0ABP3U3M5_9GAMM